MDRILRNNKKTASPSDRYEPPRVNAFTHPTSAASLAYNNTYGSGANPPRVNAYVPEVSSFSAGDSYELPPRVGAYMPAYSTPSYDHGVQDQDFAYHPPMPDLQEGPAPTATQPPPPKRPKPMPPTSLVVEPFGGTDGHSTDALPPTAGISPNPNSNSNSNSPSSNKASKKRDLNKRPTCSLSLVCYSRGCTMSHIRVTKRSKHASSFDYEAALASTPSLITTDEALFRALRDKYLSDMCGFWRRWLSLKTLKRLRLLSYTETTRPTPVPLDEFTMAEVLYAYNHPTDFSDETDWIEWVFRLRQPDKRHALEFVDGWNGTRIAVVGTVPCVVSTLIGVIWTARGGDAQTAFTVASFILTLCTVLLALLAVISGIDSKAN